MGRVRGIWMRSQDGNKYAGFLGLPFAKPPVGELRFLPPERAEAWSGEWDASSMSPRCICWDHVMAPFDTLKVKGQEDCLYLNIYTPADALKHRDHKREVIVWFHAGGFMFGGALEYGASKLMDRDVILVTVNYRLGPFGFLSLENDVLPGNNGLRDQTMALRWLQEHIDSFGGNPRAVTLMGMSAGGSSVHLHFLSPLSRGLFHGGVSLSGTALCRWVITEGAKEKARQLAASLGGTPASCSTYWPFSPFGPVVERRDQTLLPFLPDTPINMLARGEFSTDPWVTGVTASEGLYPAGQFIANPAAMQRLWDEFKELAPHLLDYNRTVTLEDRAEVTQVIKKRLGPLDDGAPARIVKMISERMFLVDAQRAAELQSRHAAVWFYHFRYRGRQSLSDLLTGTTHNYEEALVERQMLEYWTSFTRHGEPRSTTGGEWQRVSPGGDLEYLDIAGSPAHMQSTHDLGDAEFWESLPFLERSQSLGPQKVKDEL
ncbi:hypothetical protein B566_EDAN015379 [Ephemera danica]|nr:hypothetical protein B566_EDAN015379 [Ephemera danica]